MHGITNTKLVKQLALIQRLALQPNALPRVALHFYPALPTAVSNLGGGEILSAPVQTGSGAHPASYTVCTGSFLGVKPPVRGVDHLPPCSSEVERRVELYIPRSGSSWPVRDEVYLYLYLANRRISCCVFAVFVFTYKKPHDASWLYHKCTENLVAL